MTHMHASMDLLHPCTHAYMHRTRARITRTFIENIIWVCTCMCANIYIYIYICANMRACVYVSCHAKLFAQICPPPLPPRECK